MQYSISDLEQLSGVQSHTIRIWEHRYQALSPHRSAGNTRYYDDNHLVRLLNIVGLTQRGLKISKICSLTDEEIHQLIEIDVQNTVSKHQEYEFYISNLLKHGIAYNETEFSKLLDICFDKFETAVTYQSIIYPLLVRLGLMWRKDSICAAQEHFLTSIIRQKIFVAINSLAIQNNNETWLLFLPEHEEHEIGLLYANYALRKTGKKVIYLGARVPLESVDQAVNFNKVDKMLIFMVHAPMIENSQNYINQLSIKYKHCKIYLAGNMKLIKGLKLEKNILWINSIGDFEQLILANAC